MDQNLVFDDALGDVRLGDTFTRAEHRFDKAGLSVLAMPPGIVTFDITLQCTVLNAQPFGSRCEWTHQKLDGKRYDSAVRHGGAFDIFCDGLPYSINAVNHGWEALVELDRAALSTLDAEAHDGAWTMPAAAYGRRDAAAAQIGALIVEHMRFADRDALYLETLAMALTARVLALGRPARQQVSARGNGPRIARAIDHLEAHLSDNPSVAELAEVAAMSPSWFARCFKAETGMAVHAYARKLRLERAKTLLMTTDRPISVVAVECGFADQSHLTRAFRQAHGVTPAGLRARH